MSSVARHPAHEDAPHKTGDDRYAIYTVGLDGERRRLAETRLEHLGGTILTLADEMNFVEGGRQLAFGLFDREARRWIINPWTWGAGRRR